jgi:hypothetical protein
LQPHAEFSTPIESIVRSPEDAAALLPDALALVDYVELGHLGTWGTAVSEARDPVLDERLD